ncbi:MAG: restriction endonuclease subunit S [Proteobacteria bacterium]|nr:restriction endonuclease subunit S [Pseudomonadota bacterium]MBU1595485.1 restriction endonuclease subunit S [Pseudomonadota bacterium]
MTRLMPAHWETALLEDLTTKIGSGATPRGGKFTYKTTGTPLIRSMNIHFHGFVEDGLVLLDDKQAEKLKSVVVEADDVLLNITGASIGRVTTAPPEMEGARVNQHVSIIRSNGGFQPRFLSHFLASPEMQREIMDMQSGATRQALTKAKIGNFQIPLPPLTEQRCIADKIDALQAKSRRAREALKAVGPLLEKFRQSVLAAAFRGDLTAEWRKQHPDVEPAEKLLERIRTERRARWEEAELAKMRAKGIKPKDDQWKAKYTEPEPVDATGLPELPEGWCWAKVEELACDVRYGTSAKTSDDETQMPVLRMGNIVDGALVYDDLKYLDRSHDDLTELRLQHGDILFNRTNSAELVGKTAMFDRDEEFSFASYLIRVRVLLSAPEVLVWYINSPFGRQWVSQNVSQQVGQANINGSKLKALAVPIPPHEEQVELAKKVKQALSVIKGQRENSIGLMGQVAKLEQSILAKAFRGELVPQDPNDEPASVLLERIKAEREAGTGKKKTRTKT